MSRKEPAGERIRKVTTDKKNAKIDREILANIKKYSAGGPAAVSERIKYLDQEWDVERVLEIVMPGLALGGIALSLITGPYSLTLPVLMLIFFIWHAYQGWCPPIPILRYFKVRTRSEIDREKYALKALRGDFEGLAIEREPAQSAFERVQRT